MPVYYFSFQIEHMLTYILSNIQYPTANLNQISDEQVKYILFQLMKKDKVVKKSILQDWVDVGGVNSGIVKDNSSGREGEKSIISLDPIYDPKNEEFIYNYRRQTKAPLVAAYGSEILKPEVVKTDKAHHAKGEKEKKPKADPYSHMIAITQRIPHRLATSPQLTYPESLYVLDRSLEGYETAYEKCGPMRVNDQMIGFNPQGHCKVWVNEDFSNNHPSHPVRTLDSTKVQQFDRNGHAVTTIPDVESDMVADIVDTVENHCEQGRFQEPFASQIRSRRYGFPEARKLLHETIVNSRVPVPDRVDLYTNRVRGFRTRTTTQNIQNTQITTTQIPLQTTQQVVSREPIYGYRFNYLPVERPYQPEIFASRVGEHGVHRGVPY